MSLKVLFLVPYPRDRAPSQRLKFEQHLPYLEAHGVCVTFRPFMTPALYDIAYQPGRYAEKIALTLQRIGSRIKDVLVDARNFDVIYVHLELVPFGPPLLEYWLSRARKPIVYDVDDIISLPHASPSNWMMRYLRSRQKVSTIARMSRHVIVVTNYLRTCLQRYNRHVTYIPPTIDTDHYRVRADSPDDRGVIRIGWSGSHSTSPYLQLIAPVLSRLQARYRQVQLEVIGDPRVTIPGVNVKAHSWKLETEVTDLQRFDIGLYPLPETEWALGKGGLKALQYMGVGVPVVCTRYGACTEFVRDGENGFLVNGEEEWVRVLSRLIEDPALRRRTGLAGHRTVEEQFSVQKYSPVYLRIIQEVSGVSPEAAHDDRVAELVGTS